MQFLWQRMCVPVARLKMNAWSMRLNRIRITVCGVAGQKNEDLFGSNDANYKLAYPLAF